LKRKEGTRTRKGEEKIIIIIIKAKEGGERTS
jgi:hypothetical protein